MFSLCCSKGKINLEPLRKTPDLIYKLLKDQHFQKNILSYSGALAFASRSAQGLVTPKNGKEIIIMNYK